ncbi:hypothetical protein ACFSYD_10405 [Paracoccus aerius]
MVMGFPDPTVFQPGSARLSLMADADALLVRKPGEAARKAGDIVEFLPLRG